MISNKSFKTSDKAFLIKRISNIQHKKCYIDIFKLFIKENIKYTRNRNGIFFNVSLLSDEILNMIDFIISFHEE